MMHSIEQVRTTVRRRLSALVYASVCADVSGWPLILALGRPSRQQCDTDFASVRRWALAWSDWAHVQGVELRTTTRDVLGTRQQLPTHVCVPDVDIAARLAGAGWSAQLTTLRQRAAVLAEQFPQVDAPTVLRRSHRLTDLDFELLCRTADWFRRHDATGLTPRQVPVEGVHGKWLNAHHLLVAQLSGRADLGLVHRPRTVMFTYLDPDHRRAGGRLHDSVTSGDVHEPEYEPSVIVVSENKDTAQFFPPTRGGIAVQGGGSRGAQAWADMDWIRRCPQVIYWGDMDASGLEILHQVRSAGLPVTSMLMDVATFDRFARFASPTDARGQAMTWQPRKTLTLLTPAEQDLYDRLTDPAWPGPWRVEQERLPLAVAAQALARQRTPMR